MRLGILMGAALLILGGVVTFRGLNYSTHRSVLKIGEFEAKVEEQKTVPLWVGGVLAVGGLGLIVYSLQRRG
jgi:hypothetical protein